MNPSAPKKPLFSVTAHDMEWEFFRSGGKGGQNQNKRDTGVRCRHLPSGAVGESREHRTQLQNRRAAFIRCVETQKFRGWIRLEASKRLGKEFDIERKVEEAMRPTNIRVERNVNGRWIEECGKKQPSS